MTAIVDRIITPVLRRALLDAGYVIVPALPTPEMVYCAHRQPTGTFSPFSYTIPAFVPLWLNLLNIADPEARPKLDEVKQILDDQYPKPPPPRKK